jgi:hypothetical protein
MRVSIGEGYGMASQRAKWKTNLKAALAGIGLAIVLALLGLLPAAAQAPAPAQTPDQASAAEVATIDSAAPPEALTGNFDLPIFGFLPLPPFAARPFASPFVAGGNPHRTGRLFGFIPNYATVEAGAGNKAVLATSDKFKLTLQGAFDPYEFVIVGVVTGVSQAEGQGAWPRQGFMGYTENYAVGFANQAIGNVMTGAVFPSLLRQDPRYFQRSRGGFLRRFAYAGSRIFVARGDSGKAQFNYSEFAGNATAAAISNLYEPASSRTLANGLSTWETQIAIDAFGFEAKEFWPDLRRKLSHQH